ncbi:MAG: hypothetical protein ACK40G_17620 [Cytophagaceae bacterium]
MKIHRKEGNSPYNESGKNKFDNAKLRYLEVLVQSLSNEILKLETGGIQVNEFKNSMKLTLLKIEIEVLSLPNYRNSE